MDGSWHFIMCSRGPMDGSMDIFPYISLQFAPLTYPWHAHITVQNIVKWPVLCFYYLVILNLFVSKSRNKTKNDGNISKQRWQGKYIENLHLGYLQQQQKKHKKITFNNICQKASLSTPLWKLKQSVIPTEKKVQNVTWDLPDGLIGKAIWVKDEALIVCWSTWKTRKGQSK